MHEELDEPIAVLVLFEDGQLRPLRFRWNNRTYRIDRITGHWIVHEGQNRHHHYAALCEGSDVFELCYDPKHTAWWLRGICVEG